MATLGLTHGAPLGHRLTRRGRARAEVSLAHESPTVRRLTAVGLVALMSIASLLLWTAVPVACLWVASRVSAGTQPSGASILVLVVGIPAMMALGAKVLARLGDAHVRISRGAVRPYVPAWRRSISDSTSRPPLTALEKVMVASVATALTSLVLSIALAPVPAQLA